MCHVDRQDCPEWRLAQLDLSGKFETGPLKHSFAIGAEIAWEEARRGTFISQGNTALSTGSTFTPRCRADQVARYNCTSAFDPNPNDPWVSYLSDTSGVTAPIVKSGPETITITKTKTKAAYGFDSISIGEMVVLNLGARVDRFESTVSPGFAVGSTAARFELSREDTIFNWQAGAVFKPTPDTSLYFSYATSATPPNSLVGEGQEQNALGTTTTPSALGILDALKVEKTKSYEVGAKATLLNNALNLDLALFKTDTGNARVSIDANTVAFIGKKRVKGLEFGFNGNVTEAWSVFGGYSYLDAKIVDAGFSALTAACVLRGSGVPVCTVVGFPLGATLADVKAYETRRAMFDGAREIDMVINIGALKSGDDCAVEYDIRAVVEAAHGEGVLVKTIIETATSGVHAGLPSGRFALRTASMSDGVFSSASLPPL